MSLFVFAQKRSEILTNDDVILMKKSDFRKELITCKVKESKNASDVSVQNIVALKNAGIDEEIIQAMMEGNSQLNSKTNSPDFIIPNNLSPTSYSPFNSVRTVVNPADALRSAKTIAITKTSINPSKQALEEELFKNLNWQKLNFNIVRYKESADLYIEIGVVHFSWITHRYVFHVYDNRTGTIIVAGQTTSWGSLPVNLAKEISKKLNSVLVNGK